MLLSTLYCGYAQSMYSSAHHHNAMRRGVKPKCEWWRGINNITFSKGGGTASKREVKFSNIQEFKKEFPNDLEQRQSSGEGDRPL